MRPRQLRMARATLGRRTPGGPSEQVEQAHIVQLLRSVGAAVYVMGTHRRRGDYQGTMQTAGIPDLLAFVPPAAGSTVPPRLLFVECKAAGGRLRLEQVDFREHCLAAEVDHVVGNLDAVIAWLVERGLVKASQFPSYRLPKEQS